MFITITRDTLYRIAAAAAVCVVLAVLFWRLPADDAAQTSAEAEAAVPASVSDWGLSFQTEGQPPVGNVSADTLRQWNAFYVADTAKPTIYITFDAGFENGNTPAILDALKKHSAPACFFLVGNFIDTAPELVQRMVDEGHIVGNHTMHHPDMSKIADQASFEAELNGLSEKFEALTGKPMQKFYRPPQGKFSEENLKQAQALGYTTVFWSLAYVDWYTDNQPTDEQAYSKLLPRIHNGAIVLLHSTSSTNARILDELLTKWEQAGYTFGALTDLTQAG
ncbi:polysaccharide deacetylase family protein [Agathobaculum sp. NTUH-O15-33]|uniref:polysaccharide deacetylase family protein n=1 Tax=Agathobaculum sp. NTUH-O15-33 TaxID=3079302 RepID=UPI00295857C8|nr:polysaccharide deacetylase family protein [Agathobaculum sp. NTUH-O15-33]WNX85114.1 polysaccharide deacetylase family protein [Agathobaculum sp. NTUH-O15-33]